MYIYIYIYMHTYVYIHIYTHREPSLAAQCVTSICAHLPPARESNSPKEVLIIVNTNNKLIH